MLLPISSYQNRVGQAIYYLPLGFIAFTSILSHFGYFLVNNILIFFEKI